LREQVTRRTRLDPVVREWPVLPNLSPMAATTTSVASAAAADVRPRRVAAALENFPLLLGIALAAQLVVLSPVANTGYWNDDDANAYITGYVRWLGDHFWHFIWTANKLQVNHFGRPMPLGVLQTYGIFDVMHDRVLYKLMLIALTLLASAMLALVVRRLGASPPVAALAAGLPAVVWQLHLLHDPLISYVGLVQTVTVYTCGAILLFVAWLRRGGTWRIVAVVLLIAATNVTYQDGYLLPLLFIPIAWHERRCSWRRAVALALPALITCAAFLILVLVLERNLPSNSGYHVSYAPGPFLTAWAKILTSGLPLISWAATPGPRGIPSSQLSHAVVRGAAVAALLFPLLWAMARPAATNWLRDRRTVTTILAVVAVVMLTPSALTAIAPQYQIQLEWGWGYLPMFFAALGWATLGALLIAAVFRRLAGRGWATVAVSAVLAGGGGVAVAIDAEASARIVAYMQPAIDSRDLIEASFARGVLGRVPTFSSVLWDAPEVAQPTGIWVGGAINIEAWTREFVNRPLTMRLISSQGPSALVCTDPTGAAAPCGLLRTPTFWLRTTSSGAHGFVALAAVGLHRWTTTTNTMTTASAPGSQPVAYVQDPRIASSGGALPFAVTFARVEPGASPQPTTVPAGQVHALRRGAGWALVQLAPQGPFDASSIGVRFR
jgi:hypothetical protein